MLAAPPMDNLPNINHGSRLVELRRVMAEQSIDTFLTIDGVSIRWASGFTGSAGKLLLDRSSVCLITDARYADQAAREIRGTDIELFVGDGVEQKQFLSSRLMSSKTLTLEPDRITWGAVEALKEETDAEVVPSYDLIAGLRREKDPAEVARIEKAAVVADEAIAQVLHELAEEPTEIEFARSLDSAMFDRGAEALSFETICASGPNAASPHARPSNRIIGSGDSVVLDFGAVIDGYHSDMTRTYIVGGAGHSFEDVVRTVTEAQQRGCEVVRPGVKASEVDEACRSYLADKGLGDYFVHGTGHGVGLEIHEAPWINSKSSEILKEAQVVTVEPGVYLPGVGGVRVEDTVLITSSGFRRLTSAPKDSIV
ncbi:MAG TPA: Xaa-Pro dipeptidase [Acidimicrobiaceae bacterium]|nr:Xaa-Pro dipeptidase [Acidimicrobiaceae bacterium]